MFTKKLHINSQNFSGQTALITGASSGIGEALARELHQGGCNLILVARRTEKLQKIAEELCSIRASSARYLSADLTLPEGLAAVRAEIDREPPEILINNAGIGSFGYFEELSLAKELQMILLNVIAGLTLTHAVLPHWKQKKNGALIVVSSLAGLQPLPLMATYAATKAFNLIHTLALHYELRDFGIKALAICPGPTATEFGGVARVPGTPTGGYRDPAEAVAKEGIAALLKNKAWVIPCFRPKISGLLIKILPITFATKIVGRILIGVYKKHLSLCADT